MACCRSKVICVDDDDEGDSNDVMMTMTMDNCSAGLGLLYVLMLSDY